MTDEEIIHFLDRIEPVYSKKIKEYIDRQYNEIELIEIKAKNLNRISCDDSPVKVPVLTGISEEQKQKNHREWFNADKAWYDDINFRKEELYKEIKQFRNQISIARFYAEKNGFQEKYKQLQSYKTNSPETEHLITEQMVIISSKIYQLQEVITKLQQIDMSKGYTIDYGDVSVLRNEDDAIDTVKVTTAGEQTDANEGAKIMSPHNQNKKNLSSNDTPNVSKLKFDNNDIKDIELFIKDCADFVTDFKPDNLQCSYAEIYEAMKEHNLYRYKDFDFKKIKNPQIFASRWSETNKKDSNDKRKMNEICKLAGNAKGGNNIFKEMRGIHSPFFKSISPK